MDYQHKYLKYKSKYLDIKYDHRFKFIYKIDYDNDLDFKQKYFKYKSKYLDIKYGGDSKVNRNARNRSKWEPPKKRTTSFFNFSLSGPKEAYEVIEQEADIIKKNKFQRRTTTNNRKFKSTKKD
jgi:hypothetical protein